MEKCRLLEIYLVSLHSYLHSLPKFVIRLKEIVFIIVLIFLCRCSGKDVGSIADNLAGSTLQVERYDIVELRYLKTGDFSALQQMNTGYPVQTRLLIEDILKLGYVNDPLINVKLVGYFRDSTLQVILSEVERQYTDMEDINHELSSAFAALRRYLPDIDPPLVYAQISALDESIVISEDMIGISLDKYLGAAFPPYTAFYPASQRATMERAMIVPDCIVFYLLSLYPGAQGDEMHVAKAQWVTNQVVGRKAFVGTNVTAVDRFMRSHPKMSVPTLFTTPL